MEFKKSLLTVALSCGLMALPALAQTASPSSSDQQSPAASQSSADQQSPTSQSGSMSGQSSAQSPSTSGSASDASSVQSNVQSALQKDDQLTGQNVNVAVNGKNQITLSGTVSSQAQKDHAEQVATQTAGSSYMVKNKIKVGGANSTTSGSTGSSTNPQK